MKYTCTVVINLPLEEVVELWDNEENFNKWQDGFQTIKLLEGNKNAIGAKSQILLKRGKGNMELIETIVSNNLPEEKKAIYEHAHMVNTQTSRFEKKSNSSTRYTSEVEYTKFNGIMPKLMAKLFPGMFKKQSQKWMNQFKYFAEKAIV